MPTAPKFFPVYQCSGVPRIRKNVWDNWYGYVGRRRVVAFMNTSPNFGMEQEAKEWLKNMLNGTGGR